MLYGGKAIKSENGIECFCKYCGGNVSVAIDLGTTTIAIALVGMSSVGECFHAERERGVIDTVTFNNPQRTFGMDIISRIAIAEKKGVSILQKIVAQAIEGNIVQLLEKYEITHDKLRIIVVAGNTTMLHLLLGRNVKGLGEAPYTPEFLESQRLQAREIFLGFSAEVVTMPCVHAFVGGDIVSGLACFSEPKKGKVNILVDLGTNAELVIFDGARYTSTSAAAGACFEGANIRQGMGAQVGAIEHYGSDGIAQVVGGGKAKGICGSGLIDIIAVMLQKNVIDKSGLMNCESSDMYRNNSNLQGNLSSANLEGGGEQKIKIAEDIYLTQKDIRQFQLAKSAVRAGLATLMNNLNIDCNSVDTLYLSGGMTNTINLANAAIVGLIPSELEGKCKTIACSSLLGAIKVAACYANANVSEQKPSVNNIALAYSESIASKSTYIDLSGEQAFAEMFIKHMDF